MGACVSKNQQNDTSTFQISAEADPFSDIYQLCDKCKALSTYMIDETDWNKVQHEAEISQGPQYIPLDTSNENNNSLVYDDLIQFCDSGYTLLLNSDDIGGEQNIKMTKYFQGQTESKKFAKAKHSISSMTGSDGVQTKGTAMSFGFRKKLNSTTPTKFKKLLDGSGGESKQKKTDKCNNKQRAESRERRPTAVIDTSTKDDNGNADVPKVQFKKVSAAAADLTKKVGRNATTRPSSALNNTEVNVGNNNGADVQEIVVKPNGGVLVSNLKRRSKSAGPGRGGALEGDETKGTTKQAHPKTLTFNLNQNKTIEYQRRQFFAQPPQQSATGVQANVIVHQTTRAPPSAFSKFTLQTMSLPKPQYPVAISLNATTPTTPECSVPLTMDMGKCSSSNSNSSVGSGGARAKQHHSTSRVRHMDQKSAKQMANNSTRRGFTGTREISADSGIASIDMALDSSGSSGGFSSTSPKRSRSRPRHFQMIMSGRHTFEVRDVDDPPSSESNSFVESLALPKLPTDSNRTLPLPLNGLVRSNTVLSRETYERNMAQKQVNMDTNKQEIQQNRLEENVDEEKLYLDSSTSEKSSNFHGCMQERFKDMQISSSKTSSPGSSVISSWNNAGESLAVKDFSTMSISNSDDGNKVPKESKFVVEKDEPMSLGDDDISLLNTDMQISTISSISEESHQINNGILDRDLPVQHHPSKVERPNSISTNETKFAEMVLASTGCLLEDETSPTDSLVSTSESDEVVAKQKKHKINEELQEKDIDEISPELEVGSPISPGTPTHASHSLSFSDCGNLIDDEIADQPALLFNSDKQEATDMSIASFNEKTDTPTLMETGSTRSQKGQLKQLTALQQAIELSLRTPSSARKIMNLERTESVDTLSPCESICSDDLIMDFDVNSSIDSIDRSTVSIRSRSGSDLNKFDDSQLLLEFENKGSDVMKELNSLLNAKKLRKAEKPSVIANLPARATRLLNRSRLDTGGIDSDNSSKSNSLHKHRTSVSASASASRASTACCSTKNQQYKHCEIHSSSDDLMLNDKSFRNAMIQDVLHFKKQLLRLRRLLQETETLNPFENDDGQQNQQHQFTGSSGIDCKHLTDDFDLASLSSALGSEDPLKELADLRRQVVYLQSQVDDRDRTIRLQRDLIEKLEAEKVTLSGRRNGITKECINMATQTERTRPLTIGAEGLSRSKPEFTSYTTHFPVLCNDSTTIIRHQQQYPGNCYHALNRTRRHTIISTTLTNYNQQQLAVTAATGNGVRPASIAWETHLDAHKNPMMRSNINTTAQIAHKPVRITLIGDLPDAQQQQQHQQQSMPPKGFSISDDLELKKQNVSIAERKSSLYNKQENNFQISSVFDNVKRSKAQKHEHQHQQQKQKQKQPQQQQQPFHQLHCPTVTIV